MITESQKKILKAKIKKALRESMFENGYFENLYPEGAKTKRIENSDKRRKEHEDGETYKKRTEVMKWLDSAQELHSILAYKLWPDKDEDEARSLFSKKYRGEDADGNNYSFDDTEINELFNMKDRYIEEIS